MSYIRSKCIVRKIGRGRTQARKLCFDENGNITSNTPARKKTKAKRKKRR